jgi:hypothetical protein
LADGANTIDLTGTINGIQSFIGGTGDDSFKAASMTSFNIYGGIGTDTLSLTTAGTFNDFSKVSGIEALKLANGTNYLALSEGQFSTIIGGTGNDEIDASACTSPIILDGGGLAITSDKLTGGTGADLFILADSNTGASYYGKTTQIAINNGINAKNFASIFDFSATDKLQLSSAAKYTIGDRSNGASQSGVEFGLYADGNFVANIQTDGNFSLATNADLDVFLKDSSKVLLV